MYQQSSQETLRLQPNGEAIYQSNSGEEKHGHHG
jgi:hypothetical protein